MYSHHLLKTVCPQCQNVLYAGDRVIGPSVVICKKCSTTISTPLQAWNQLDRSDKIRQVFRETLSPTFLRSDDCVIRFLGNLFIWVFSWILFAPQAAATGSSLLRALMMLWYPALLAIRLFRMASQSNRDANQSPPPVW